MLRWPTIIRLKNEYVGAHFLLLMESGIYRTDIRIPAEKVDDAEFVAAAMARGWASIWSDIVNKRIAPEGAQGELDAVDVEITPHYRVSDATDLDTKNLYTRPGKVIKVNGPIIEEPK